MLVEMGAVGRATRAVCAQPQIQLRKARRDVLIGSCRVCLLIGFKTGMIIAYPKQQTIVVID